MNRSVGVNNSITLSWKGAYTALEKRQFRGVSFKCYPQHNNSSAVEHIGAIIVFAGDPTPGYIATYKQRISVVKSASAIREPAITIQDMTKQDEAFYWIEVFVGKASVANHTIFLTVFGNYVFTPYAFIIVPCTYGREILKKMC